MVEPGAVMIGIGKGIELRQCGELDAARSLFAEIWAETGILRRPACCDGGGGWARGRGWGAV
ncbi:MAG: hypothetical protein ACRDTC_10690 [Pseudonocardiaceae bacterium]